MTREHAGHTWTYDREHRCWRVANTELVVYVGLRGDNGRTETWEDALGNPFTSLPVAMSNEAWRLEARLDDLARLDERAEVGERLAGKHIDRARFWRRVALASTAFYAGVLLAYGLS